MRILNVWARNLLSTMRWPLSKKKPHLPVTSGVPIMLISEDSLLAAAHFRSYQPEISYRESGMAPVGLAVLRSFDSSVDPFDPVDLGPDLADSSGQIMVSRR